MVIHFLRPLGTRITQLTFWGRLPCKENLHTTSKTLSSKSTVISEEVDKFNKSANEWWNGQTYHLLRSMNKVRVPFIRDGILAVAEIKTKTLYPLERFSILDVGCGGGLLSEPLARLGASVTGLDPGPENIQAAVQHASKDSSIKKKLNYICDSVENLCQTSERYDAVVCSEVVEHVADVHAFVNCCVQLTKPGGSLFFTTINRTALSYITAIVFAEYLTGLIPRGTHDWNKFVEPIELTSILQSLNCGTISVEGIMYNPITKKFDWQMSNCTMYALHAVK